MPAGRGTGGCGRPAARRSREGDSCARPRGVRYPDWRRSAVVKLRCSFSSAWKALSVSRGSFPERAPSATERSRRKAAWSMLACGSTSACAASRSRATCTVAGWRARAMSAFASRHTFPA